MADERVAGLCSTFLELLPVDGASVSVFDSLGRQSTVCTSGPVIAKIEELQFDLGEGPQWDALRTGTLVLVPHLERARERWPVFAGAALEVGAAALFAFPMRMGAVTVGVVGLYCALPGDLIEADLSAAVRQSHRITRRAVAQALRSADHDADDEQPASPALRREVHQATGMVLVQLDTDATEAFARIRGYAFASGLTVQQVARQVVTRELDFRDLGD
jgi:hypothetical protein